MNILLVDDQPDVISGVLVGVRWDLLDIDEKYTATDIFSAQKIIQEHSVDLMLCDIEMPLGSGLELYQWVLEQKYRIKCIFLTAHADFSYMQSAIQMNGFDYLLLPASYDQIEASIRKAIDQIKVERVIRNYYEYGIALKKKETTTTENILRNYLLRCEDGKTLQEYFRAISLPLTSQVLCNCALLQVISWGGDSPWKPHLFQYAINNVFREMLSEPSCRVHAVALSSEIYFLMVFPGTQATEQALWKSMEEFAELCPQHLGCSLACYMGKSVQFPMLPDMLEQLQKLAGRNVSRKGGVYPWAQIQEPARDYVAPDFGRWDILEKSGLYDALRQEMQAYMDRGAAANGFSPEILRQLHQDVVYWFIHALGRHGGKASDVFDQRTDSEYNYEAMMSSYQTVERMRVFLEFLCSFLKSSESVEPSSNHMERIEAYIRKNIQKNITRKELADAVYLNPEYLSRLFKKEKGCTLSEYITTEKMFLAKSLLETTNFSVSMIASKVGYGNFSHFAQCFKKEFGVSPSDIRQNK